MSSFPTEQSRIRCLSSQAFSELQKIQHNLSAYIQIVRRLAVTQYQAISFVCYFRSLRPSLPPSNIQQQFKINQVMWLFNFCCRDPPSQPKRQMTPVPKEVFSKKKDFITERQLENLSPVRSESCLDNSRSIKKDRYQGEELDGVPHGNGSMLYANGDFYRGEWVNGKKEGRGLQIYQELNMQYEGEWQSDKPSGAGKLLLQNSSHYIGQFKNGLKHGKGQFYDFQKKKLFNEYYSNGELKQHIEQTLSKSREEEFPTLVLDKERFNTEDLHQFEDKHPEIKQFDIFFLLKYYGLCRLSKLEFINKCVKEWTIKEVIDFLDAVQLRIYKELFYKNKVKGKDLVSLTEKELKDDLKMKMGDRKRFLNYMIFLTELQCHNGRDHILNRKTSDKRKPSYKLRSATSMKKVLRNVKNYAIFEESIKEESSQSQNESQQFRSNQRQKAEAIYPSRQERQYGSAAIELHSLSKDKRDESSLEDLIEPKSERSSAKQREPNRKDSKDMGESMNNNFNNHPNKSRQKQNDLMHRHSQQDRNPKQYIKDSEKSSSTSSEESVLELQRKKTYEKNHQSSEIRELYQFLKGHRSLQFLIKEKDIVKLEQIGEGGYGKVYKGKYVGMQIAIKDYMKTSKHHHKEDFMKEVEIISDLKHPNIVLYMGMCITANKYTLITEYLENGSLFDQLHKKKKKFTPMEQIEIAFDIVKGMVYLHNMKKILHRDLKSSNVLIGEDWQVKLCDFGLSAQKKKQKKKQNRIGTYQWMAPEVIRNEEKIDQFADVYSFGVIVWEMLSEKIPYFGLSEQQIIGLVGYDNDHVLEEPSGPPFLISVMQKCLKRTPSDRPTFIQIQSDFEDYLASQKERTAN